MKSLIPFFALIIAMFSVVPPAGSATVFQDDFENGALGGAWSLNGTNNGRATVTADFAPAGGLMHLVLDDSVNDAVYSVAEAMLTLDLSNKKNVVLSFKAKSLGDEPHAPPTGNFTNTRNYDGVAISVDGGTTWRAVQSLSTLTGAWQSFAVQLDASVTSLGGAFGAGLRIRFSQYDNSSAPLDGIAMDDVLVTADDDQRALLEMPSPLLEGTGPYVGYALVAYAPATPLTLNLSTSPTGQITTPATVTIPAGQTYATFNFSVNNDNLVNLTRAITVNATATGVTSTPATILVTDDDVPVATLTLPATLTEGALPSNNASISIDRAPSVAITFTLSANPASEVTIPSSVTIPVGQTQVVFTARAVNDTKIDGNISVTVTASAAGIAPVSAVTTTIDNETKTLALSLPATVQEGGIATGTVTIPGTLTAALTVNLTSSSEAWMTVPASVTIAAGATQATFTMTGVDNALRDGSRPVNVVATATDFTGDSRGTIVRDNDVASYRFATLTDIVNISSPTSITVTALDIEGNAITATAGTVNLNVVLPDGTTQALTPATATLAAGTWTGSVTFPNVTVAPLRLHASDAAGNAGDSNSFDIMRVLNLTTADLLWDGTRGRICASVPASAGGAYANQVVTINPATLQVTGAVTTGQDPGQLALTSGGEYLYTALNGNGTVAKINATGLTLASTFAVGTSPSYGTLYAEDISTVAGQPDVLIVSQYRKSVSPRHNGVAAYDNGVIRPNKTQEHTGSNVIEPSANPAIFFGYNTETSEFGFRRLQLDANGMTELVVNTSLIGGYSTNIRSDGNLVFSDSGVEVDGSLMKRVGSFGVTTPAPVRPDMAANRIYFIEPQSTYSTTYDKIGAYDPNSFSLIRRLSLPSSFTSPASFIRWGTNGLAFRTATSVVLISSSNLVPSDPPANLAVTVQATPNPATVGGTLTYTVSVVNQGPNIAHATLLSATLSDSQTTQGIASSVGTATVSGTTVSLPVGDLASGASATLTVTTIPQSAGSLSCTGSASSNAVDPDTSNNTAFKFVSVGFLPGVDVVNQLRLTANNLIYDPTRKVLWASIPSTVAAPLGRTIVGIDPATGLISDPIPINASPVANCMALSGNGRYLYVGLSDSPEVHRIDLTATPLTSVRLPLGLSQWGDANYAQDIEVLDGDGTSFLVTGSSDHAAMVFDGSVRRTNRTGIYTVDRIERTATPGIFVGYNSYTSGFDLSRLTVTASGVTSTQSAGSVISGYYAEIRGSGNLLLSSTGLLVDSSTLTLKSNLGFSGRPAVDAAYQRAYLVNGNALRAFDTVTGSAAGTLALPTTSTGDWAQSLIRWGLDGHAILGNDGKIYLARWSSTIPPTLDSDGNGIADAWEATNFGRLHINPAGDADGDGIPDALEYLFGTSPLQSVVTPLQSYTTTQGGQTYIHLTYPRRSGLAPQSYGYETSCDLTQWTPASSVTETVLSTQTLGGIQVEMMDAAILAPLPSCGFARLKWLLP